MRRQLVVLMAGLLVPVMAPQAAAEHQVKLVVLGETHGTGSATRDLLEIAEAKGATGCICPGDFIYGSDATPGEWKRMMAPFMAPMLPAQGNHDWPWSDWESIFPDGDPYYSEDVSGVQFISVNPEHSRLSRGSTQREWLEDRLAERDPSALKVVLLHRPWWLPDGARHPSWEFEQKAGTSASTMQRLMETHGVDLVVAAHEKNYQHSIVNGIHYLVAGAGGPEFNDLDYDLPGAVLRRDESVVTTLELMPDHLRIKSYDREWNKIEDFAVEGSPASTSDRLSGTGLEFEHEGGNRYWVQMDVDGPNADDVVAVDVRETGGHWRSLELKSWGHWARSMHVDPGHEVQFRAVLSDGSVERSCWFTHPAGAERCDDNGDGLEFEHAGGDRYWVQVDLDGDDADDVVEVDVRETNGPWRSLDLKSWGHWARSMHVNPGHDVQFRATLPDDSVAQSCWFTHPEGVENC